MSEPQRASATDLSAGLRRWLASGAIQADSGALCAWRDEETSELAFEYPEITGYGLTWFASQAEPTAEEHEAAARAGHWLVARLGAVGNLSARDGWDGDNVYNFDVAMIASGLLNIGRELDASSLTDLGLRLVDGLANQIDDRQRVPAIAAGSDGSVRSGWSVDGEAHMLKALQCFLLAEAAGRTELGDVTDRMAASAGDVQEADGRFRTQPVDDRTMLHPHLYAVEGLWTYGVARGDDVVLDRARLGAEWAWGQRLETGGFPRFVGTVEVDLGEGCPEQFDLTSQALRAACLFDLDPAGREKTVTRLAAVSRRVGDGLALPYQPAPAPVHHNAWVGMFAAQAAAAAANGGGLAWSALV